jgi:hypothetical protein
MQYYQHYRQAKLSKPRREMRQVGPKDTPLPEEWQELKMQLSELVRELKDQRELKKQMRELVGEFKDCASLPRGSQTPAGDEKPARCFKCGCQGHLRKDCSLL